MLKKIFKKLVSALKYIVGTLDDASGADKEREYAETLPEGKELEWTYSQLQEYGISLFWVVDSEESQVA